MIEVRCRPTIEPDAHGGWDLVLWAGEPFDYSTPFRKMLAGIADALGKEASTCIKKQRGDLGFVLSVATRRLAVAASAGSTTCISANHGQGQWCPGKDSNLHGREATGT